MCGIIGYTGGAQAAPKLLNGLKRLDYRGYDSSGIAVLEDGKITVVKANGKIAVLDDNDYETTYTFTGEAVEIDVVSQPGEILITPV